MAEQQRNMLEQLVAAQAQMSQQLWAIIMQALTPMELAIGSGKSLGKPAICIPKMTSKDDPEVF